MKIWLAIFFAFVATSLATDEDDQAFQEYLVDLFETCATQENLTYRF
jgi:hypothetical protein